MIFIEMLPLDQLLLKLILALILGGLIGVDREIKGRPAGLRTHVLVCVGATLFTIISMSFIATSDPARIAAGIVTGIGFLGAGAIFRSKDHVQGLTTAADLWVIAAVGIAIGIGYYSAALAATILVLLVLLGGKSFEHFLAKIKK